MINVPQEIKDILHQDTCQKNIRIHFPNGERTDICNDQIVMDTVSFKESLCSQNTFKFGLAESPIFECEVVGVSNIKGATIEVSCEIYCPSTVTGAVWRIDIQQWVYPISYGLFTVQSCDRQSDLIHRKIVCYSIMNGNDGIINPLTQSIIYDGTESNSTYSPDLMKMAFANTPRGIELGFTKQQLSVSETARTNISFTSYTQAWSQYGDYDRYTLQIDVAVHEYSFGSGGISADDLVKIYQNVTLTRDFANTLSEVFEYENMWKYKTPDTSQYVYNAFLSSINRILNILAFGAILTKRVTVDEYGHPLSNDILLPLVDVDSIYSYGTDANPKLLLFTGTSARIRIIENDPPETHIEPPIIRFDKTTSFKTDNSGISLYKITPPIALQATFEREAKKYKYINGEYTITRYVPKMDNFDVYKLLGAALELIGCFMNIPRGGSAAIISIRQKFGLTPAQTLYPDDSQKPQGVTGGSILPEDYQTCWYDEHYILPFGAINIAYKDVNGSDAKQMFYVNGYNISSDDTTYQVYELTDNMILQNRKSTDSELETIAGLIGNNLDGVTYMPVKLLGRGLPYVEPGDTFEVFTSANDSITTIVLSRTLKGEMVLTDEYVSVL